MERGEERMPVAEICGTADAGAGRYSSWKKKRSGLLPTEMKQLKPPEAVDGRLKNMATDLESDREILPAVI